MHGRYRDIYIILEKQFQRDQNIFRDRNYVDSTYKFW